MLFCSHSGINCGIPLLFRVIAAYMILSFPIGKQVNSTAKSCGFNSFWISCHEHSRLFVKSPNIAALCIISVLNLSAIFLACSFEIFRFPSWIYESPLSNSCSIDNILSYFFIKRLSPSCFIRLMALIEEFNRMFFRKRRLL